MLNITPINNTLTAPLTFDRFYHHMNFVTSTISHTKALNDLYASDPTYFGSTIQDPAPAIDHILALLSSIFHLPQIIPQEVPSPTPFTILDAWVYSFNCGELAYPGAYIDELANPSDIAHRAPDLTTIESLYSYLIYVYERETNEK